MEAQAGNLIQLGVLALLTLSGVMAVVFVTYIKNIMSKLDSVSHIEPLLDKFERLVSKVESMFITLEITREKTNLEIEQLRQRITTVEGLSHELIVIRERLHNLEGSSDQLLKFLKEGS